MNNLQTSFCGTVGGDAFSVVNEYVYEASKELKLQYDDNGSDGNGQFSIKVLIY